MWSGRGAPDLAPAVAPELALGWSATLVGCIVLWGLKWVERRLVTESRCTPTAFVSDKAHKTRN
jgi:hypothetical protein